MRLGGIAAAAGVALAVVVAACGQLVGIGDDPSLAPTVATRASVLVQPNAVTTVYMPPTG